MGNQVVRPDKKGVAMPQHAPMKIARKPQKGPEASSKLPTGLSKLLSPTFFLICGLHSLW